MTFIHLENKDEIIFGSIGLKDERIIVIAEDQEFIYITKFPVTQKTSKFIEGYYLAIKYCNDHRIKLSEPELDLSKAMLEFLICSIEKKRWWNF